MKYLQKIELCRLSSENEELFDPNQNKICFIQPSLEYEFQEFGLFEDLGTKIKD